MPATWVECRTLRHAWKKHDVEVLPRKAGYVQILRCMRCGAERGYEINRRGVIVARLSMHYPEGYVRRGHGRMTAEDIADLRVAMAEGE